MANSNPLRPKRWFSYKGRKKGAGFWIATALFFGTIAILAFTGYALAGEPGRFAYGVTIGGHEVGGLTNEDASALLGARLTGLRLSYRLGELRADLTPATTADGETPIFAVELDRAVKEAMAVGHQPDSLPSVIQRLTVAAIGRDVPITVTVDRELLDGFLEKEFGQTLTLAQDAKLEVHVNGATGEATAGVTQERAGFRLDLETAARETEVHLRGLTGGIIELTAAPDQPRVAATDIMPLKDEAAAVTGNAPLTLHVDKQSWTVSRTLAADWISTAPDEENPGRYRLAVNADKAGRFLTAKNSYVYVAPTDAAFEEKDGRVIKIVASRDGVELDVEAGIAAIEKALFRHEGDGSVDLPLKAVRPEKPTEIVNPYGVKEIIGIGESNFRNSPANRRHNISVGANSLSGLVIPPGETFSTIKSLGNIDAAAGYRQELVIKGNKTKPEYGGGLCQIGTTIFRAALDSGLPITERQNHSYRVPYYERDGAGKTIGPGKDATIYNPAPDLKFVNDTGHPVIIMGEIEGDTLRFILWGVKDGRTAEQSAVRVYNEVPPPAKQMIETDDLPPGKVKCTESPHAGADAVFTYKVTYADGSVKEKTFFSHYRPWGAVCLVGRDPNAPKPDATELAPASADATGAAGN